MTFLEQEITFDIGHLVLLLALIGFVFFVSKRCRITCSSDKEDLEVKTCRCQDCLRAT